jgi:hypothetical protein
MSAKELISKLKSLGPEQRKVIESLIELLADSPSAATPRQQSDLTDHPSFGAWAHRKDLPADSDEAARDWRKQAVRRRPA